MLRWFLWGTAALLQGGLVACGAMAVRSGWLLPWLRRRTLRPELWGYGAMSFGTGMFLLMSWGELNVLDGLPHLGGAVAVTGLLLMAAGAYFQLLSARERLDV
ncbi:hypothetical protein OG241_37130 [Streptomyces sp. NBC_01390]|uniref:hypothetical protein n=1 Tax=Streptomyces sp. NBC_01390 TaxID=2903850 RepID=UPI003251578C